MYSNNLKVSVGGEVVSVVKDLTYLGHHIKQNREDSLVQAVSQDFICKINSVIADFSKVSSKIKHNLVEKYCLSLYGGNFSDFSNVTKMQTLYRQWRNADLKIWGLPRRTHSKYLPIIYDGIPLQMLLMRRFLKFFKAGMDSSNPIVSFVFNNAMYG